MDRTTKEGMPPEKEKRVRDVIYLLLGILTVLGGSIVFYAKIAGSRYGVSVENGAAQIVGLVLILYGIYRILAVIRKLGPSSKKRRKNESAE